MMLLRVKKHHHAHGGKIYREGETFEGSERLLAALGDKLEAAEAMPVVEPAPEPDVSDLVARAEVVGLEVDGRWSEKTLREKVEEAEDAYTANGG